MNIINGGHKPSDNKNYYHVVIFSDNSLMYFNQYGCRANVEVYLRTSNLMGNMKKIIFLGATPISTSIIPKKYIKLFPQSDIDFLTKL